MLTKKVWLGVCLLLISLLGCRLFFFYGSKPNSGELKVSGQVLNEPYLRKGKLNFRLDRYLVVSEYKNIVFGDFVAVTGNLVDKKLVAKSVQIVPKRGFEGALTQLRLKLNNQIKENLPSPQSELLTGVVLGIKSDLDPKFKQNLINTGTLHVVVVSGYNIALVAGLVSSLSFLIGRKKANILAIGSIVIYTLLVGASAPTLRAALMGTLTLTATLMGRQALSVYLLFLTGYLLLLVNPRNLVDISFQLTFLATLGLIMFTKRLSNLLSKLTKVLREPLATTLAAQSLVTPLIVFYFGNLSLIAPLVNVLVLWSVPTITLIGFTYLAVGQINTLLASVLGYLLLLPLTFFVKVVEFFGQLNLLVFQLDEGNWFILLGYLSLLTSALVFIWQKTYVKKQNKF